MLGFRRVNPNKQAYSLILRFISLAGGPEPGNRDPPFRVCDSWSDLEGGDDKCSPMGLELPHQADCHVCPSLKEKKNRTGTLSKRLEKLPPHSSVSPFLKQWLEYGNPPQKNVFIVALTNLKHHGRYKQALEVAEFFWKNKLFPMDDTDHMYRLYLVGQVGTVEDVEKCFASIPSKHLTEKVYNQLISCYLERNMITDAENTLERLRLSGRLISALPYNQLMLHHRRQGQLNKAFQLLKDMNKVNVLPDTRTYNLVIGILNKQGNLAGVLSYYKDMKNAGIQPDVLTCSLVAKAYMSVGMVKEADLLADEIKKFNPNNCWRTKDLLVKIYAELGNLKEVHKVWNDLESKNNLSARSYGVMIESLGKQGLIDEAVNLANVAEKKKGKLPKRVYNALMSVYTNSGMIKEAESLMDHISKGQSKPNCVTYRYLIGAYLKTCQVDKALECLRRSKKISKLEYSKPWFESLLLVLNHLAEKGEYEASENAFQSFTNSGSYRSAVVYNTLMKVYLNAGKYSPNFLQRMIADGVQPNSESKTLLADIEFLQANQ